MVFNRRRVEGKSGTPLSELEEGTLIKIPENNQLVEFYLAKHNYEPGLNGNGRTLVVRKDCTVTNLWGEGNGYKNSNLNNWLNNTYKPMLEVYVDPVKFYYTPGRHDNTVTTMQQAIFALSLTELGGSGSYSNVEGSTLPISDILKIAYLNGNPANQWTRTPYTLNTGNAWRFLSDGTFGATSVYIYDNYRPAFCLYETDLINPDTMEVIA